jgi:DNA-binding protein H-NS
MTTVQELIAQKEALEKAIAQARKDEYANALKEIKALMDKYGLTVSDLGGKAGKIAKAKSARAPVAPKYRDPVSGATWTGRGRPPKWTAGKDMSKYTI